MPIIIAQLIGGLAMAASSLVGRVLLALGLGFATFLGFDALISSITGQIDGLMSNFTSSSLAAWGGFFQIDKHISMGLSAVTTKVAIKGMQDGKKMLRSK